MAILKSNKNKAMKDPIKSKAPAQKIEVKRTVIKVATVGSVIQHAGGRVTVIANGTTKEFASAKNISIVIEE